MYCTRTFIYFLSFINLSFKGKRARTRKKQRQERQGKQATGKEGRNNRDKTALSSRPGGDKFSLVF